MIPFVPEIRLQTAGSIVALWEERSSRADIPYWAAPWAGGLALARHVLDRPELVRGRSVLDVGTGSGLVAIAAARAGASRVRAIDVDPEALVAARANAIMNGVALELVEGDPFEGATVDDDVVLIGDLFYEARLAARALAWLRAQAGAGRDVLAGDPGRSYAPRDAVEVVARYEVPTDVELEGRATRSAVVLRVFA